LAAALRISLDARPAPRSRVRPDCGRRADVIVVRLPCLPPTRALVSLTSSSCWHLAIARGAQIPWACEVRLIAMSAGTGPPGTPLPHSYPGGPPPRARPMRSAAVFGKGEDDAQKNICIFLRSSRHTAPNSCSDRLCRNRRFVSDSLRRAGNTRISVSRYRLFPCRPRVC
jgi:hypothetical protein